MIERARERRQRRTPTIFFLDEIHRFNKAQQDALLPAVEEGLRDADRGDDREPVLRGQLGAAARARRSTSCSALSAADIEVAAAPRDRARRVRRRRRSHDDVDRVPRRPQRRRRAHGAGRARAGVRDATGDAVTLEDAEDALQRRAVLYDKARRPALRHDLGLDQGDARLGPRRLAVLPGGDARGRRGPALHRPAHGHPRLRGHRQRRPAGARGRGRGGRTRSSTSGCPRRSSRSPRRRSTCRWRRSPTPPSGRSARPAATSASTAPRRRRPTCATAYRARRRSAAARATTTRTACPATCRRRS